MNKKLICYFCILFLSIINSPTINARKIGIIAFGSLVNQPTSPVYKTTLHAGQFKNTDILLPIDFLRLSSKDTPTRRITLVIDPKGSKRPIWVALSDYKKLPEARADLSLREGLGGKLDYIAFIKKLEGRQQFSRANHNYISKDKKWVGNIKNLPDKFAHQLAIWAEKNGFDALIWTALPRNKTKKEIENLLNTDNTLLANTQEYIKNLPTGPYTTFDKELVSKKAKHAEIKESKIEERKI